MGDKYNADTSMQPPATVEDVLEVELPGDASGGGGDDDADEAKQMCWPVVGLSTTSSAFCMKPNDIMHAWGCH